MGSIQTTHNHEKRCRVSSSSKATDSTRRKRGDRLRTTLRSITLRALAARNSSNSVSSSNNSTTNNSSFTSPNTMTTINSNIDQDLYLNDFDYRKFSTLTGLSESKVNELHREFLILSNNGQLSYERYKTLLETLPGERSPAQIENLARQTFASFDKDGNNYLDFTEFIAAFIAMEKNELDLCNASLSKQSSVLSASHPIASLTRHATTYYSQNRALAHLSPTLPRLTKYLQTTTYASCYPQWSERYLYVSPQYAVAQRERL